MGWLKGMLFGNKKKIEEEKVEKIEKVEKVDKPKIVISDEFERQKTTFTILPTEIFSLVISYMSPSVLGRMACTSREYYFLFKPILHELTRPATIDEFEVFSFHTKI